MEKKCLTAVPAAHSSRKKNLFLTNLFFLKEHIQKAIELNSRDPTNYHLLGRWCYEVRKTFQEDRNAAELLIAVALTQFINEHL